MDEKIALEQEGTAAYQRALNERTKLLQKHEEDKAALDMAAYNNEAELINLEIEREKELLDAAKDFGGVSNQEYYNKLLEFEEKKYNLKLEGYNREQELYKNDLRKYQEIEQKKLILTAEFENEKQKLVTESIQAEVKEWQELLGEIGDTFSDNLSEFLQGNQTIKESFLNIFSDIKSAFAKMIAEMIVEQTKLTLIKGSSNMSGYGGVIGAVGSFFKGFFADGGVIVK